MVFVNNPTLLGPKAFVFLGIKQNCIHEFTS